jgi:prephenate dehydrogenase
MCGKEKAGLVHADAKLFWDSTFALTETERTTPTLRRLTDKIIAIVGAQALWIDAATHDRWTAATSHLPYLVSVALAASTPQDVAPLVGPGFHSTSRLAVSEITMMIDILITNQEQVLTALSRYRDALYEIEKVMRENPEDLRNRLEIARQNRESIIT